jgi:hypothetical protein
MHIHEALNVGSTREETTECDLADSGLCGFLGSTKWNVCGERSFSGTG